MREWQARQDVCEYGRRLWQLKCVAANDGNLSVRLDDDKILATPTGVSKGFMEPGMLILTDLDGRVVEGEGRPSSELKMHLEVYKLRPDVRAVVHAHPPVATAFSVAGMELDKCLLPESVLVLGAIPIAPYATPSTDEIPNGLRPFIPNCDAVLLANHGAVCWADSLQGAYYRMETLEHTATITHHAMLLGRVNPLSEEDVAKLRQVREKMGITGRVLPCEAAGTCAVAPAVLDAETEALVDSVTQAVLAALKE